jgi:hypothetical protein
VETTFENITLDANQIEFAATMVVYPDNPISIDDNFVYTVQPLITVSQALMGGVDYHINKPDCSMHSPDAGI